LQTLPTGAAPARISTSPAALRALSVTLGTHSISVMLNVNKKQNKNKAKKATLLHARMQDVVLKAASF
jgi:protein subunit release factor A